MLSRLERKHPLVIRWFHWINFPVLGVMIFSGLLIYWANGVYRIGWGDTTLLKFFPTSFYNVFSIPQRLAEGMAWHFMFMWIFALNGLAYVVYTIVSGEWRYLVPTRKSFSEAIQVTLYDLHLRKTHPPQRKYNGAQQIAYTTVILMGIGSVITGLAIYKPTQLQWMVSLLGGYEAARVEHFILTIGYVLFFVVHIVQVIRAGWNNFQAMITGVELVSVSATTTMAIVSVADLSTTQPVPSSEIAADTLPTANDHPSIPPINPIPPIPPTDTTSNNE